MPRFELTLETPIGRLLLCADADALTEIRFDAGEARTDASPVLEQAERELREYFAGVRKAFSVPISPKGTPFQRRVWDALRGIPYGETVSYGEVARRIGSPRACRAVGMANHRNPIPIVIPCHRVIGADGGMTGYGGGLEIKKILLELEGIHVKV